MDECLKMQIKDAYDMPRYLIFALFKKKKNICSLMVGMIEEHS